MLRFKTVMFLLFSFLFCQLNAQPEIEAVYTAEEPKLDGRLDESIWSNAFRVHEFSQREPNTGSPATERTEFFFLYNSDYLFIGVKCYQNPQDITSKEMARDVSLGNDDRVQVILDSYMNGRTGYWFQIGPRGSIGDALVSENGISFNKSWDGMWDGKARIHEYGWDAEMAIPFKTIGFDKNSDTWGIKLIRYIMKKSETDYWPATTLNANKFQISDAGRMKGLKNINQGIGLDIVPYITGGLGKNPAKGKFSDLDGGMDIFYQISPSLKVSATYHTDFAQTEVDERQINLSRFDLYFPEKRDFFLDGSNYFNFGISGDYQNPHSTRIIPFFSRRIGLDSGGNPVPVEYGGKFTGQAGNWNIGMLHIKDDNIYGNKGNSVVRITRNLGKQSTFGFIGTNGQSMSELGNSVAGFDLKLASAEAWNNRNIVYNLYGLKSFTEGVGGDDFAFGTELNYPNDFFNFRLGYMQIGQNFNPGIGFLPRKNIRNSYGSFQFGPRPKPESGILQIRSGLSFFFINDLQAGELLSSEIDFEFLEIRFLSGDVIEISSHSQFEKLEEDFNIYKTVTVPADSYRFWWHMGEFTSALHRNFWIGTSLGTGKFYTGSRTDLGIKAGYKVFTALFLGAESERRFVKLEEGDFIAQIWRFNLNILISPEISWYNFIQYDSQSESAGWQSRFQWILKPGREFFLVYNSPFMDPMNRFRSDVYEARIKLKYTFRF